MRRLILIITLLLLTVLLGSVPALAQKPPDSSTTPATGWRTAIAPADLQLPTRVGVERRYDYGAFALYRIADAAWDGLTADQRSRLVVDPEADYILFDRHPLHTPTGRHNLPDRLTAQPTAGPALHLVQFVGPIRQSWLDAVAATGATPIQYIASNAYLVWADADVRAKLDLLAAADDFVQYSGPHQPGFKLGSTIERRILEPEDPAELVTVDVQIYNHPGNWATRDAVARVAVAQEVDWWPILAFENSTVVVRAADLAALAQRPDVVWIGERFPRELHDEVQTQIVAGFFNAGQTGPSAPGYKAWLDGLGFSQSPADYPIVSITDDGVGNGSTTNGSGDVTLTQLGNGTTTRLTSITNCTADASGDSGGGHGHINTSIVGGYDTRSGFPFQDANGYLRGMGINPYGRMAGTKIFRNSGGYIITNCGGNDAGVIKRQQDNGVTISSNSWGCSSCAGSYDTSSQAYDAGTRDADTTEAGNQQLLFVFSAGNSGSGAGTIGTPGNGKNMLTVGASENNRPSDESGSWTDGCGIGPTGADNAMDIISFSSRGPAPGGRIKPETIAPGTHIQGAASTSSAYTGNGVCDKYRPGGQTTFAASSGTSHSAPAVSGVASLYTYWLQNTHGVANPSPALVKGYVLAHPTYLTGVSANDTLPSNAQGYGMPNLRTAFDDTPRALVNQTTIFDNSGETWTWTGSVADPTRPLRIVLNYTDAAGTIGASPQVNNLNLSAVVNGTTYLGNRFSGQWSTTGGSADNANNYEAIFLPPGTSGPLTITVTAFNIAGNGVPNVGDNTDQDFALVCYNCTQSPDFTVGLTPPAQTICAPQDAVYTVNVGSLSGFGAPVTLNVSGQPAGTTAVFTSNPVTPAGSSTLTIGNTGAAAAGAYTLNVTGSSGSLNRVGSAALTISIGLPGAPATLTPADGSAGTALTPTLSWTAVSGALAYTVQVATDPGFTNIVATADVPGTSYTLPAALASNTPYYWRVWASNGCGGGALSATAAFMTAGVATETFCRNVSLAIPDNNPTGVTDSQTVALAGLLTDLNVSVRATHTWVGDLTFRVRHVASDTTVTVIDRPGVPASTFGCQQNHVNATLDDQATLPVENQCATSAATTPPPYAIDGAFTPNNPLSAFNGRELSGSWSLTAVDAFSGDTGTLTQWCLIAAYSVPLVADFSDLPGSYGVAWHSGTGALRLGANWNAAAGFAAGSDDPDDDGVTFDSWTVNGGVANLTVTGATGYVTGWIDWNQDGDFLDAGEQVFTNEAVNAGQTKPVAFTTPVPVAGQVWQARFRVYPTAQTVLAPPQPYGGHANGEVEDYTVTATTPLAVGLRGAPTAAPSAVLLPALAALLLVAALLLTWARATARRR